MKKQHDNMIDMLYDEECDDNILLVNENGEEIEFEQIALIPLDEKDYAILKPVKPFEDMEDDEALAFAIDDENERLVLETEQKYIDEVFAVYDKLVDDYNANL